MAAISLRRFFERKRMVDRADMLAIAVAVSLPWSTSATSFLVAIWAIAVIAILTWTDIRRELMRAVGGLPVLLFAFGVVGMFWAQVPWYARFGGLDGFVKLLAIPLLIAQFRRSDRGKQVLIGFLVACTALLIASVLAKIWPNLFIESRDTGVAVKNYIVQSAEFAICAAVLVEIAVNYVSARRWAAALATLSLGLAFLIDILFVVTSRTTLVIIPVLVLVYGVRKFGWRGLFGLSGAGLICTAVLWGASPVLRNRVESVYTQTKAFETKGSKTSTGERIVFWTKSLEFIASAPVFGHGTGSIAAEFRQAAVGRTGVEGEHSSNPHNLTFAVAIQIGIVGAVVLWAMWVTQINLFWNAGIVSWIGLVIVLQNAVGSLFNSFIFDFTEGWIYVFGVGVLAGMLRRSQDKQALMTN